MFFISDIYIFNELSNLNKFILEDFGIIFKVICLISFRILLSFKIDKFFLILTKSPLIIRFSKLSKLQKFVLVVKYIIESFKVNDLRDLNCMYDLDISILIFLRIKISIFESIFSFNGQLK